MMADLSSEKLYLASDPLDDFVVWFLPLVSQH